jgi:hypothetical protein
MLERNTMNQDQELQKDLLEAYHKHVSREFFKAGEVARDPDSFRFVSQNEFVLGFINVEKLQKEDGQKDLNDLLRLVRILTFFCGKEIQNLVYRPHKALDGEYPYLGEFVVEFKAKD